MLPVQPNNNSKPASVHRTTLLRRTQIACVAVMCFAQLCVIADYLANERPHLGRSMAFQGIGVLANAVLIATVHLFNSEEEEEVDPTTMA